MKMYSKDERKHCTPEKKYQLLVYRSLPETHVVMT